METQEGNTPLHISCEWDHIECTRLFCDVIDQQSRIQKGNSATEGIEVDPDQSIQTVLEPKNMLNSQKLSPIDIAYEENAQSSYSYICTRYGIKKQWQFMCSV